MYNLGKIKKVMREPHRGRLGLVTGKVIILDKLVLYKVAIAVPATVGGYRTVSYVKTWLTANDLTTGDYGKLY